MEKLNTNTFVLKLLLIFIIICAATNPYRAGRKVRVVVLNAGHGGNDPGCHGLKHLEKEVALSITLKVGKYIEENLKDVKVVYTRKTDVFVPLNEIASHANKNNADLFVCIHCNAAVNKQVFGSETYVMGLHKTKGNLDVAKRENAAILFEEDYKKKYEGFDPNSDEANIIFNMYQNAFLEQSLSYASKVQNEFKKNKNLTDKGVKQAGFLVLWKTSMPSVLIETGFLTHAEEEKYLGSQKGQDQIAFAIYKAFKNYKAEVEGYDAGPENEIRPRISEEQIEQIEEQIHIPTKDTIKTVSPVAEKNVVFKIQIANSSKKIPLNSSKFEKVKFVEELEEDKSFKYLTGNYKTMNEAFDEQRRLRKEGFNDAFTVAFIDGKKSTIKEAKDILEKNK
ncbi:MAG TPA: N-acetylmuramoyl-L-alanine amidase [Bacteroidia bacterium]|nr:N-acetylmuramoyl-L-alanine amidase [Bacteroidia bacterium]